MSSVVVIIQSAPYGGGNRAWDGLRFAGAALTEDLPVRVHLLDEAVRVAARDQPAPEGVADLGQLLGQLMECGLQVSACGKALDGCGLGDEALLPGVERGSMKFLAGLVRDSRAVLTF